MGRAISSRLAMTATVLVWLALIGGLFGRFAWPLDLLAHFRVQYVVAFAILTLLLLLLRRPVFALLPALGVAIGAVPLVPYMFADSPMATASASTENFRVLSFNVWYRNPDIAPIAQYMEQSRADVVVLLELTAEQAEQLQPLIPSYPYTFARVEPSRMGAAVFSKWPVLAQESRTLSKGGAIAVKMKLDWQGTPVTVLGVHLNWPMGGRNSAYREEELNATVEIAKQESGPLVIAGDFNLTPWSEYFQAALEESGMHDAARGFGLKRSWPSQFAPLGIRIDHCWLSPQWHSVAADVGPALGSDHLPVIVDLQLYRR